MLQNGLACLVSASEETRYPEATRNGTNRQKASMPTSKLARLVLLSVLVTAGARADTIHLKNGASITAENIREKGDQVEYTLGASTYTIPRSMVDRIERSGGSFGVTVTTPAPGAVYRDPGSASGSTSDSVPGHKPRAKLSGAPPLTLFGSEKERDRLRAQIINLGRVDGSALAGIEAEGNAAKSAVAYFEAARYELEHNQNDAARSYLRSALSFRPDEPSLIGFYVYLLVQAGEYPEAVRQAEHGAEVAPGSADMQRLLGLAYYGADKLREAIAAWQRAQQIQPNDAVQGYLAKAEREIAVEDSFSERQSPHFVLRYQGRQAGFNLGSDLLRTLERQYSELSRELDFAPQSNITVLLYTEKEFFDVTQAPGWAGGANDGKLRIPVADVSGITPRLEQVLKHELTHSFIHYLTRGRCPGWLNEGIAQMMEPKTAAAYGRGLAHLFETGKQAPLSFLEGSFSGFSSDQATVAYAESLAAVEYLRANYGMSGLRRMLQLIGDGERGESALRATTGSNYPEFEKSLAEYLAKTGTRN